MSPPDVVIPVRKGDDNEELRYALRSLSNLPHRWVWIAGHMPPWVTNVRHCLVRQNRTKHENSLRNLLTACREPGLSEDFVLWNDDIFLLAPLEHVPVLHGGTIASFIAARPHLSGQSYIVGLEATAQIASILGAAEPLCYELHVPLPMNKTAVLEDHARATSREMPYASALQMRSLHGNLHLEPDGQAADVKVGKEKEWSPPPPGEPPFVSTSDSIWQTHPACRYLREVLYPEPGPYELVP